MRALLIVNPASTSVRTRLYSDVAMALSAGGGDPAGASGAPSLAGRPAGRQADATQCGSKGRPRARLDLSVVHTTHRGHAAALARDAVGGEVELIVVLGGDGTVNEVLNGMTASAPSARGPAGMPMLGLVGGGKTNVFARALGLPGQALKAANMLLALLEAGESRRIGLGEAAGRRFAVGAGLGLDGAIVREVERQRRANRAHDDRVYVLAGLRAFAHWDRSRPRLRVELAAPAAAEVRPGRPAGGRLAVPGYFAIASNGDPYTYLGPRPFRPTPDARFEDGLDLLVAQTMSPSLLTRAIAGMLSGRALPPFSGLPVFHDRQAARMVSEVPLPFQVDGEYLGDVTEVEVGSWPDALTVVAPREAAPSRRPVLAPWWAGTRTVWRPGGRDRAGADGGPATALEAAALDHPPAEAPCWPHPGVEG